MSEMDKATIQRNYRLAVILLAIFVGVFVISMVLTHIVTQPVLP